MEGPFSTLGMDSSFPIRVNDESKSFYSFASTKPMPIIIIRLGINSIPDRTQATNQEMAAHLAEVHQ